MIGRRFKINLTDGSWIEEEIPRDWVLTYGGGTGLALKAFQEGHTSTENPGMVMAPGLLAGTNAPAGHWSSTVYCDPATGRVAGSYCGGHWGCGLRSFGGGLIEIHGRTRSATALVLTDGRVDFADAQDLMGLDPQEAAGRLGKRLGHGYHIASIGVAGEMGVPMASLVYDGTYQRQSAGLGAVLGRMGLKALAVKGAEKIVPSAPESFYAEARGLRRRFVQNEFPYRELSSYGSAWFLRRLYREAILPVKNYTASVLSEPEMLSGELLADSLKRRAVACSGCPVGCRWMTADGGRWSDGLELEDVVALGTLCGITNPGHIARMKANCNRLGIDPRAFGGALAAVMEGNQAKKDGGGPTFGEAEKVLDILEKEENPETALAVLGILSADKRAPVRDRRRVGFMSTDPRADAHLALHRVTWPFETHVLGSGLFVGDLPLYRDLPLCDAGEGISKVAKAVQVYQDFSIGLQSLGFCPWTGLSFTAKALDPLLKAALGEALPDGATSHFGRAVFTYVRSLGLLPTSESGLLDGFGKLSEEPITDGPKKGEVLNIIKDWHDYMKLRDESAAKAACAGKDA
jgi:aldehyde:ferredoxin oxidoreductase